ncbi:MAG: hypothetical protein JKX73_03280, partial [Flavobacteriales bacterium]|nr:hypothetical protein [Flavobacteriales bacterium]
MSSSADTTFVYTYGGLRYEEGTSMVVTADSGYAMLGTSGSFGFGNSDIYLVKADSNGNYLWSKNYGGTGTDVGLSIKETADSGFIFCGYTNSSGAGGYDVYLVRTDAQGDTLWTNTFGGFDWDMGFDVVQTSDGGFAIAGETFSFGAGDNDVYLIKTNAAGDSLWTRTYGGVEQDYARSLFETADSGFIVGGATYTYDVDSGDAYLIKTNALGDTSWTGNYGGTRSDWINSVIQAADSGYAFIGTSKSYLAKNKDIYVGKVNSSGVMSWFNPLGSIEGDEEGSDLVQLPNSSYALISYSNFFGEGEED